MEVQVGKKYRVVPDRASWEAFEDTIIKQCDNERFELVKGFCCNKNGEILGIGDKLLAHLEEI